MRLVKIKEGQQLQFFASNAIDVYANKFQSTNKIFYLYQIQKTQFSFLLSGDQIYSDFLSLTDHQKKKKKKKKIEKLKNSFFFGKSRYSFYFAKFHTEIL